MFERLGWTQLGWISVACALAYAGCADDAGKTGDGTDTVVDSSPFDTVFGDSIVFDSEPPDTSPEDTGVTQETQADSSTSTEPADTALATDTGERPDTSVPPLLVDRCRLQFPAEIRAFTGTEVDVFGRLEVRGLTDLTTDNSTDSRVTAQLGFGPAGAAPPTWSAWIDAAPNSLFDATAAGEPALDEYVATLTVPAAGDYAFAFAFSVDGGTSYTYCDLDNGTGSDGSEDGYQGANAGAMVALADPCDPNPCADTPPVCAGSTLRTFPATGTCTVLGESADCTYPPTSTVDCAVATQACDPMSATCVDDPCNPNPCVMPPAPTCDGNAVVTTVATGSCQEDAGTSACTYAEASRTDCGAEFCTAGVCNPWRGVAVGDVAITEIMAAPVVVADQVGEWFEITSLASDPVNLRGVTVRDQGASTFDIDADLVIAPGAWVVLARNGDMSVNGGVSADFVYAGMQLVTSGVDAVILELETTTLDAVTWDTTWAFFDGASLSLEADAVDTNAAVSNDDASRWCPSNTLYGDGDRGTPGAVNDACPNPCLPNPCDTPPDGCSGTVLTGYQTPGSCDVIAGSPDCSYREVTSIDCHTTDQACDSPTRACVDDACTGVICDSAPAPQCGNNTVVTFAPTGTCQANAGGICAHAEASRTDCSGETPTCNAGICVDFRPAGVGDLVITEIMTNPAVSDATGEFFELYNVSADRVNLEGLTVQDDDGEDFVVTGEFVVEPGAYAVFIRDGDLNVNGQIPFDYVYGNAMAMSPNDELVILRDDTEIDRVVWVSSMWPVDTMARSMALDPGALTASANDDPDNWCLSTSVIDSSQATPGDPNDLCSPPLCDPNPCTAPPVDSCTGEVSTTHSMPGTCDDSSGSVVCDYAPLVVDCATNNQRCQDTTAACVDCLADSDCIAPFEVCGGGDTCVTGCQDDVYVGNGARLSATVLDVDILVEDLVLCDANAGDWFQVALADGDTLEVLVDYGGSAELTLALFDPAGTEVAGAATSSFPTTNSVEFSYLVPAAGAGNYTFRISGAVAVYGMLATFGGAPPSGGTLFFSEYIEGSSSNKAVEIYNGDTDDKSLANCAVNLYANGGSTPFASLMLTDAAAFGSGATIAAGELVVICANATDGAVLPFCDDAAAVRSSVINFNGDDALQLVCDGAVLDVIGQVGFRPSPAWGSGGITTQNDTLVRCGVTRGDAVGDDLFDPSMTGTWLGFAQDEDANLGAHTVSCP
ncbi:MAG: hypothetical protein ACI9MR_000409 [Myxococcota bacterium]|jgi:hypothetical protein